MAPLIDQKGAFLRYEVLMNEDEFKHIMNPAPPLTALVAPPLYDARNQKNVNFPLGRVDGPEGPIEVKAAWKAIGPLDNPNRYHTEWVQIAWPVKSSPSTQYQCSAPMLMGLVALHISHKTKNAPQWAWSTFEQVDNYTPQPGSPFGRKASLFNPDCPPATCPPNKLPTTPAGGWNGDPTVLNQGPPTQVVPGTMAKVQTNCNTIAQNLLRTVNPNTVWQYYRLVSTQWPQDPNCDGKPCPVYREPSLAQQGANQLPVFLANGAIETYFMNPKTQAQNMATCMYCHSIAQGLTTNQPLDFSYLLQEAYPISSTSIANLSAHRMGLARSAGIRVPPPRRSKSKR